MPDKQEEKKVISPRKLIIIAVILLFLLAILTKTYGSTDIGDYTNPSKFFAGESVAKLRLSHSVVYGLVHSPFVKLTKSFLPLKLSSVLWLSLLILSVYYISNKNRKTLILFLTTPIVWYMSPWVNPIQLSSLFFIWGYYFIKKYEKNSLKRNLLYSGLLLGLAWAFWDSMLYFAVIFAFCFLYNKKTSHFVFFFLALLIGSLPKLITDQLLFGFAFYSTVKHIFAEISFVFYSGIYGQTISYKPIEIISLILFFPVYSYLLLSKKVFLKNKKTIIFIILSFILIFINAQIRASLVIIPLIILILGEELTEKKFKIQLMVFLIISLIVIEPYIIQIKYATNGEEFTTFIANLPHLQIKSEFSNKIILEDLNQIAKDYPNQTFVVGNQPDDYQKLAELYWGKEIKEFISIQDYQLFLKNETQIAGKTLCSASKSWNRRDICFSTELRKSISDNTDYSSIKYAISLESEFKLKNFTPVQKYKTLSLFEEIK